MGRLARHLREAGWEAHAPTVAPSWGQVGLDELAKQVSTFVGETFAPEQRFDIVGFSMGGLVCRYYLQRLGGLDRVDRFVANSTPHQGSLLAWLIPNEGCRQMRPGSHFLQDLASDAERLGAIRFTNLWTPFDLTIVPAVSSVTTVGASRKLWSVAHPLMVWERRSLAAIEDALSGD